MFCWPPGAPYWALTANVGFPAADPVVPPAVSVFTTRYPTFAGMDQALLGSVLAEAANEVDTSWRTADQQPAIMAYAAHLITLEGLRNGTLDVGGLSANVAGPLTTYQAGDTKISFASSVATSGQTNSADGDLVRTVYGLRFLELRNRNRVPTALIA